MKRQASALIAIATALVLCLGAAAQGPFADLLWETAELESIQTGYDELDDITARLLGHITTGSMSGEQQLQAAYAYIVENYENGGTQGPIRCQNGVWGCTQKGSHSICSVTMYATSYDEDTLDELEDSATLMEAETLMAIRNAMLTQTGTSREYAGAFAVLANAIGYEAHLVNGSRNGNSNSWASYDYWVLVRMGNSYYIFDPYGEQRQRPNNEEAEDSAEYRCFGLSSAHDSYSLREGSFNDSLELRSDFLD